VNLSPTRALLVSTVDLSLSLNSVAAGTPDWPGGGPVCPAGAPLSGGAPLLAGAPLSGALALRGRGSSGPDCLSRERFASDMAAARARTSAFAGTAALRVRPK